MTDQRLLLEVDLVYELEMRLRAQSVPVDQWKPGLSDFDIAGILSTVGLTPSREACVLWGWHDGSLGEGMANQLGPVGPRFLDLASAVECYKDYRKMVSDLVERTTRQPSEIELRWNASWLPFIGWQLPAVLDCSVDEGEVFSWWISALDTGAWRWHTDRSQWSRHPEHLDSRLQGNRLL